jgi:cell wall-associated NlpC family hydrolase
MARRAREQWRGALFALLLAAVMPGCGRPPLPGEPIVTPLPGPTGSGGRIAEHALTYLGAPYAPGGTGAQGFDCSGLALRVYADCGIPLPRTAADQSAVGEAIARSALAPGDLVFFSAQRRRGEGTAPGPATHVGIYVGDGRMVHAPGRGDSVAVAPVDRGYFDARYQGARRLVQP